LRDHHEAFYFLAFMTLIFGVMLILPVGGADIPVVIAFDSPRCEMLYFALVNKFI